MSTLSIKSRNPKSAAPKKGSVKSNATSRRKVTSPAANAKKPTRSVELKAERVATAKAPLKAGEPKFVRATKQKRVLTLLSPSEGARHVNADETEDKSVIRLSYGRRSFRGLLNDNRLGTALH